MPLSLNKKISPLLDASSAEFQHFHRHVWILIFKMRVFQDIYASWRKSKLDIKKERLTAVSTTIRAGVWHIMMFMTLLPSLPWWLLSLRFICLCRCQYSIINWQMPRVCPAAMKVFKQEDTNHRPRYESLQRWFDTWQLVTHVSTVVRVHGWLPV
jgi:hypothetical protein